MNKLEENPYRLFFPAGILLGLWGVALWILFFFERVPYPGGSHPDIMMGGFLLCFVLGFLMTAVPKFTGSFPMSLGERWVFTVLLIFEVLVSFAFNKIAFYSVGLMLMVALSAFLVRRFRSRTTTLPPSFIFIGAGLLLTTLSLIGLLLQAISIDSDCISTISREYFYQGFLLFMVIGVGTKLVPMLTGQDFNKMPATSTFKTKSLPISLTLFVLTFLISFKFLQASIILRGALVLFIFLFHWRIHHFPNRKTWQTWGLWLSSWAMASGILFSGIFLNYRVHFLHLYFIGGLGLLTLMIATRVTLAHGGHGLELESRSKVLPVVTGLILLSAATRVAAGFVHAAFLDHLFYAAVLWCVALVLWGSVYFTKMLKFKGVKQPEMKFLKEIP